MTRYEECKGHALAHADHLVEQIKAGQLRASAFEGAMRAFLQQPGYDVTFRGKLLSVCLTRFDGRSR
jgi:hypothetical protein